MRDIIHRVMHQSDDLVLVMNYADAKGVQSRRVVSPIRFLSSNRFLALCLCREEPRQFYLERCSNAQVAAAADFVMPVAM